MQNVYLQVSHNLQTRHCMLTDSSTSSTTYCPPDGPITDLLGSHPTFAHVRGKRLDAGHHVSDSWVVFPRLGSIDIRRGRRVWSFGYALSIVTRV